MFINTNVTPNNRVEISPTSPYHFLPCPGQTAYATSVLSSILP